MQFRQTIKLHYEFNYSYFVYILLVLTLYTALLWSLTIVAN